ncbi:MAG: hypothetical protein U0359_26070 [Byssovorax sp.]
MIRRPPLLAGLASLGLIGLGLACLLGLGACEDRQVHVFSAFRYDADHDCLEAAAVVDVIDGPDPGTCPAVHCWENPLGDAFVTDQACDAPLDFHDHSGDADGPCAKALAAFARDGMGKCPAQAGDGGA